MSFDKMSPNELTFWLLSKSVSFFFRKLFPAAQHFQLKVPPFAAKHYLQPSRPLSPSWDRYYKPSLVSKCQCNCNCLSVKLVVVSECKFGMKGGIAQRQRSRISPSSHGFDSQRSQDLYTMLLRLINGTQRVVSLNMSIEPSNHPELVLQKKVWDETLRTFVFIQ